LTLNNSKRQDLGNESKTLQKSNPEH